MGWKRLIFYYWHRLQRTPGTPSSIALGFAIGAGMAISPYWGTHMAMAIIIALPFRANLLAVIIGAQIANPWTVAPLWLVVYYLGALILGHDLAASPPDFVAALEGLTKSVLELDRRLFIDSVWPVLGPMTLGSIPLGTLVGVVAYYLIKPIIERVHKRRADRLRTRHANAGART
jgi:uncharacterized protein (DUF2062 family)